MKKSSFNIAFGGMVSAICVVLEFSVGILPLFLYIFPMICALLMNVLLEECGVKTALCAYIGTAVISMILAPDKEAALLFAAFFGYYPIVRAYIMKLKSKLLRVVFKLALFNIAMICSYLLLIKLIGLEALGFEDVKWMWAALLAGGNFAFLMFDIMLDRILIIYNLRLRGKLFGSRRKK